MEEKKAKKRVDPVVAFSIMIVTAIICIFNSWLYFNNKIEQLEKGINVKTILYHTTIEDLNKKNQDLQTTLDKLNADVKNALENNQ